MVFVLADAVFELVGIAHGSGGTVNLSMSFH